MIRPSNLERRAKCPGSGMEEGLPNEESAESKEGTDLHHFLAHPELDRSFLPKHHQELLKKVDGLDQQVFQTVIDREHLLDSDEYVEEREVQAQWNGMVGHIDLRRRYPKRGVTIIRDVKFGYIPVERAEMNLQLRGYATMSVDPTVYVIIIQPRAQTWGQVITMAIYGPKDIADARKQIEGIIAACEEPDAPLHAGDWCRYCKARSICPELAKSVESGLVSFEGMPEGLSKTARLGRVEARLANVSNADLSKMLNAYSLIQFIHEPMLDEARRRIEAGLLDGYKLGKPLERRKITDSQKAISLLALAGMDRADILMCANLSLTKLEDALQVGLLRLATQTYGKKEAREFTNRVLSEVIEIETGKQRVLRK